MALLIMTRRPLLVLLLSVAEWTFSLRVEALYNVPWGAQCLAAPVKNFDEYMTFTGDVARRILFSEAALFVMCGDAMPTHV